jgi:hypothetical protein
VRAESSTSSVSAGLAAAAQHILGPIYAKLGSLAGLFRSNQTCVTATKREARH